MIRVYIWELVYCLDWPSLVSTPDEWRSTNGMWMFLWKTYVQLGIVHCAGVFQEAISKGVRNISFGDLSGKLGVTMYISSSVNYKFVFYVLKTGVMASVQLLWSNTRSVVSFTPGCKFTQGSDIFFWRDTGINLSSGYHHIFHLWSGGKFMKVRTWKIFAKESQLLPSNLLVYSVGSYPSEWTIYEWSELLMGASELAKANLCRRSKLHNGQV